jgi:TetR/AcrR family transcriptional regulator
MDSEVAQTRRLGLENSQTRARFIDAAEAVLRDEGLPALTARQVAAKAGLKTQLLYYYFRTMDDLILALVTRVNENRMVRFEEALASPEPLRALWRLNSNPSGAALASELTAIATHREAIRAEIVSSAEQFRALLIETVTRLLAHRVSAKNAAGIVMIAAALARMIVSESALGLTDGHEEALAIVEEALQRLSTPVSSPPAQEPG